MTVTVTIVKTLDDTWISEEDIQRLSEDGTLEQSVRELVNEDLYEFANGACIIVTVDGVKKDKCAAVS